MIQNIFSSEEIEVIHEASLEILEKTGFLIKHEKTLRLLADSGALVDFSKQRAWFPRDLVEKAIARTPREFLCAARDKQYDLLFSPQQPYPYYRTGAGPILHYDFATNESRPLTRQDAINIARLTDYLPNFDMFSTVTPQDIPVETYDIHTAKDALVNCRKHVWALVNSSRNLRYQLEMFEAVSGGRKALRERPCACGISCILEPFYLPEDEAERIFLYGEYGVPMKIPAIPIVGVSSPYTLAGTIALTNAEVLGIFTIIQTIAPGHPTWYYSNPRAMDMKTMTVATSGSPDIFRVVSAIGQLCRYYGFPGSFSLTPTSCQPHEILFTYGATLVPITGAGQSLIGTATFEGSIFINPAMMVIMDEMQQYTRQAHAPVELTRDRMGIEAIIDQGPQGEFLASRHTMTYLRKEEHYSPRVFEWIPHDKWAEKGHTDIFARADEKAREILDTHEVPPVDPALEAELEKIAQAADRDILSN